MRSGPKALRAQRGKSEFKLSQGSDKEVLENSRGCCQGLGCRREMGVGGRDSSLDCSGGSTAAQNTENWIPGRVNFTVSCLSTSLAL